MSDLLLGRLLDASIQGVVAVSVVWLATMLFRRLAPSLKCWLWRMCGVKCVLSLIVILGLPLLPAEPVVPINYSLSGAVETSFAPVTATGPISTVPSVDPVDVGSVPSIVWFAGVGLLLVGRLFQEFRLRWLRQELTAVELTEASSIASRLGLRCAPPIYTSHSARSPFVAGALRPIIVVPQDLLSRPDELDVVLAHELAHIRRRDLPWQAFLSFLAILFWFLPPVIWISKLARSEAEMACDRMALDLSETTQTEYSRLLVRLSQSSFAHIGALGMGARARRHLERRIIAMSQRNRDLRLWALLLAGLVLSPAIVPWRAVAQDPPIQSIPSNKLEEIAMRYRGHFVATPQELGITDEQKNQMEATGKRQWAEFRIFSQKLEDMKRTGASDRERIDYDQKTRMPMFDRHERESWGLLSPTQKQRMAQLTCQYIGPMILGNSEVAKLIDLPERARMAIAKISANYDAFVKRQNHTQFDEAKAFMPKQIKLRNFTPAESRRMAQLTKERYDASGAKRDALNREIFQIRQKGIRYEFPKGQSHWVAPTTWSTDWAKKTMTKRRAEFARAVARASALIPITCSEKWQKLQGKPYQFRPMEIEGQVVITYR